MYQPKRQRFQTADRTERMSRPVPEAAPVVGLVLSISFAIFGFLFSTNHLATLLVSVVLLYAFTALGIVRSPDPDTVFLPDSILAAAFVVAVITALFGLVDGQPLFGTFVALVITVPAVMYHVRYGESVNPLSPDATLLVGLLFATGFVLYGSTSSLLLGGLSAGVTGLASVDYRRQRGGPLDRRSRSIALVCCLGGGLVTFGVLTVSGRATEGLAAGSVLVAIGVFLAVGADAPQRATR